MGKLFLAQEAFTKYNAWTEADNFLLVECLVSQTSEEAWREVAERSDNSGTFDLESTHAKARRKYAAVLESVDIKKVEDSRHGIQGWAEMNVVVAGINDGTREGPNPVMVTEPKSAEAVPEPKTKPKPAPAKGGNVKPKAKGKGKAKKEGDVKELEKDAKDLLCKMQRSQAQMEQLCGEGSELPSEFAWTKSFLKEYEALAKSFKEALQPEDGGEDLSSFVSEMKLAALSPSALKQLRKSRGDRYGPMLTLLVDRCGSLCTQTFCCNQLTLEYFLFVPPTPFDPARACFRLLQHLP